MELQPPLFQRENALYQGGSEKEKDKEKGKEKEKEKEKEKDWEKEDGQNISNNPSDREHLLRGQYKGKDKDKSIDPWNFIL